MKKNVSMIFELLIILVLVGCTAPSETIANAVKATMDAQPTEIPTTTITLTPTQELTSTTVPTPSPTPDLRVVMVKPRDFVLEKADLPKTADYILPNELWSSPVTNEEIIQEKGIEEGNIYLSKTGRVTGWEQYFLRRNKGVGAEYPYEIGSIVVQYKTEEGAKYPFEEISKDPFVEKIDVPSKDLAFIKEETYTGKTNTFFEGYEVDEISLNLHHRNFLITVRILGYHDANQVSKDLAVDLAMKSVEKIDKVELFPSWVE
jgi:hypothetical protein